MNNQNFYLRLIALLLIIMAVFFYNGTVKDKEQAQDLSLIHILLHNMSTLTISLRSMRNLLPKEEEA